ncbi:MAG: phytanoyl-CoA dioxygenase family protein [Pseudomonadota bacterium]|jgi:hypothetical protein
MTSIDIPDVIRNMPTFAPANDLLTAPEQILQRIDEVGYVFLQGVLDTEAVARLHQKFLDYLKSMGVVAPDASEPVWNGEDLTDFPLKAEPLHDQRIWKSFVGEPSIDAFFRGLLGGQPFWVPIVEYRVTPPTRRTPDDLFQARHQDGFYNKGIDCLTCWAPLMEIEESRGGLAVADGMNDCGNLHDLDDAPQFPIPRGAIPDQVWRRAHYRPGDLMLFNAVIPHTGLPNFSDRFRLSLDVRVARPGAEILPLVGVLEEVHADHLMLRNDDGERVCVKVDENTYCRWQTGKRLSYLDFKPLLSPGLEMLISMKGDTAVMLRPSR